MPHLRFISFAAAAAILSACSTADVMATPPAQTAAKSVIETKNAAPERPDSKALLPSKAHSTKGHSANGHSADGHKIDGPRPYDKDANAWNDVDKTLNAARDSGKMSIVAMGANWCHDSRGLAGQFEKERFQTLFKDHYELVYVDVGWKNRNMDIAQEFGVDKIVGTPTVFVISSNGDVLNLETAPTWRNADSRSEDEIFDYFESFTKPSSK